LCPGSVLQHTAAEPSQHVRAVSARPQPPPGQPRLPAARESLRILAPAATAASVSLARPLARLELTAAPLRMQIAVPGRGQHRGHPRGVHGVYA